jgi:octaprenyl-diphosphate synthase
MQAAQPPGLTSLKLYLYRPAVKSLAKLEKKSQAAKQIKKVLELINPQLYVVEERIRAQAKAFDPAVEGYVAYACESNGKRLRPALALLSGAATGGINASHFDLAVVLELIHAATLVHDDIMDGAEIRRNQPTANAKWGNAISVLLGDCLFAHALKLSTNFPNGEISRAIATAAADVCSGEITQTQRRFDLNLTIPEYYRIIEMKTAALFAAAGELGAFINEASPEVISGMKAFGLKLGTAYQVYDDCLDIAGEEKAVGKTLGTDLQKGKLTLPLLYLLQNASPQEHRVIAEIILTGTEQDRLSLVTKVRETGSLTAAIATGQKMIREAQAQLGLLPATKYRDGLTSLCDSLAGMIGQLGA